MSLDTVGIILIVGHIIGTIFGVGGATMIEVHMRQAFKDKLVSADERGILGTDYRIVRIGIILILLSGFGFLILDKLEGTTQYLYSPRLWAKMLLVIIIAVNTLLLQAHKINLYWGSALSFVSWWWAALIGMFITHGFRFDFFGDGKGFISVFSSYMIIYLVALVVGGALLHYYRSRTA